MNHRPLHVAINAQLVAFEKGARNSGISRATYALLESLSRRDSADQRYTAFINAAQAEAAHSDALSQAGERLRLAPAGSATSSPLRRILWEQLALPSALRRAGADVFHAPVNVLPAARLPCPAVVTVHDLAVIHYPQYFRPERRVYQRIFTRRSARAATLIVAVSESTKRDLVDLFGVPSERVRVVYSAIEPDFVPVADPARLAAFRARQRLPERYLLFVGNLEPRKNLLALVEAYATLRALDPQTPPLIIAGGKGWYYQAVFDRVRALQLERQITFAGYIAREDQPLWYSGADLFVYPSAYEGFGLPVAEALACGTPTLTSNVSSLPEAGGAVAVQVAPNDPGEMAHALQRMLADPMLRQRTAVEGPRWTQRFSLEHMAAGYAAIYQEAADHVGGGSGRRGR
ncbi:MAG TPA: glycosyltransferase family 1 protein [Ktedonobacterales bacterium]